MLSKSLKDKGMRVQYLRARDQTADLAQDIGVGIGSVPTLNAQLVTCVRSGYADDIENV